MKHQISFFTLDHVLRIEFLFTEILLLYFQLIRSNSKFLFYVYSGKSENLSHVKAIKCLLVIENKRLVNCSENNQNSNHLRYLGS